MYKVFSRYRCRRAKFGQKLKRCYSTSKQQVPDQSQIVICGGGIAGLSVAYHLAKFGWKEILLLEQGKLTCGTTWHSAGLVGLLRKHRVHSHLCRLSSNLYEQLKQETGIDTGYKQSGSIALAQTKDRLIELQRKANKSKALGIDCEFISLGEVEKMVPYILTHDLEGALYIPGDGTTDPNNTAMALAKGAKSRGVKIMEGVRITKIGTEKRVVSEVETDSGNVKCEIFINCAGMWARDVGCLSEPQVAVPLQATEHQYLITKAIPEIRPAGTPYVRDLDGNVYFRELGDALMVGGFALKAKPAYTTSIPYPLEFVQLQEDWDHFRPCLDSFLKRVPAAEKAEVQTLLNGPESFTPDMGILFGPAIEVDNYYVLAGFNSGGIASSGGAGQLLAEWITYGEPSVNVWPIDTRRFSKYQSNKHFLIDRVSEVEGLHYRLTYPDFEHQTGRKLRCSPLYSSQVAAGAVFGEKCGQERPNWFLDVRDTEDYGFDVHSGSFGKPGWFDQVLAEYWACREGVCVMDMTFFSKFEISSPGNQGTQLLQKLCCNEMDMPVGSVVHSGMLNERGCYENDCSVARLTENKYYIICPSFQQVRGFNWIKQHLPTDGSVKLKDVSHNYTGLNVLGPRAREVLQKLTDTSLALTDFKPFMIKELSIGFASHVRAMSITHTGEDGFVLYIPSEHAIHVYDTIKRVGKMYGVRDAGYYALRWLRQEKTYAYWGDDFGDRNNPYEIGREQRVKYGKSVDFIGKDALWKIKEEGPQQHLALFLLEDHDLDHDVWPWGGEPIYIDDKFTGFTTSTGYGPSFGKPLCLGWITNEDKSSGKLRDEVHDHVSKAKVEIMVADRKFPAKAFMYPPVIRNKRSSYVM